MKRIAAPMVGGMASATLLTLLVIPVLYSLWRERQLRRRPTIERVEEALHDEAVATVPEEIV
jgi:hypothetical protein